MSESSLTDAQKLKILKRFSKLSRVAEAHIHGETRFPSAMMTLLDAFEVFGESIDPADCEVGDLFDSGLLQTVCEMNPKRIRFSPTVRHYIELFEPRCVGELYYIDIGGQAKDEMLESLYFRFDISVDADPVALGWRPKYWSDTSLISELNMLILNEERFCDYRKYHKRGIHYFGEALSGAGNRSSGKRRYADILRTNDLFRSESRLWSTFVVPPDWTPPNWAEEELWKAELPRIAEDRRERLEIMREIRAERRERQQKKGN